ncbi:MAG: hypothetical protein WCT85_05225, partial [Parachlamydiales bacterium]
ENDFDQAGKLLEKAEKITEMQLYSSFENTELDANNKSNILFDITSLHLSMKRFSEAIKVADKIPLHFSRAAALIMITQAYILENDFDQAGKLLEKAEKITEMQLYSSFENAELDANNKSNILFDITSLHISMKNFSEAIRVADKIADHSLKAFAVAYGIREILLHQASQVEQVLTCAEIIVDSLPPATDEISEQQEYFKSEAILYIALVHLQNNNLEKANKIVSKITNQFYKPQALVQIIYNLIENNVSEKQKILFNAESIADTLPDEPAESIADTLPDEPSEEVLTEDISVVGYKSAAYSYISYGFLQDNNFVEARRIANKIRNKNLKENMLEQISLKESEMSSINNL